MKFDHVYRQLTFQAIKVSIYQRRNKGDDVGDDVGDVDDDVSDVGGVICGCGS